MVVGFFLAMEHANGTQALELEAGEPESLMQLSVQDKENPFNPAWCAAFDTATKIYEKNRDGSLNNISLDPAATPDLLRAKTMQKRIRDDIKSGDTPEGKQTAPKSGADIVKNGRGKKL